MAVGAGLAVPALIVHTLAAVVWVGGMFFAHQALRPAAAALDPPLRLPLWSRVFDRFFAWVIAAIVLLLRERIRAWCSASMAGSPACRSTST